MEERTKRKTRSDKGIARRPQTTAEAAVSTTVSRETEAHGNEERPERISVGARIEKLAAIAGPYLELDDDGQEVNWHYLFCEDNLSGNLERYKRGWYEIITDERGEPITYPSGQFRMILLKIPMKYYLEDRALLEKATSDRIKKEIVIGKDEYAPDAQNPEGGDSALKRNFIDPTL